MIDRDIDLTEDFVFVNQDEINKKTHKSSNIFDESINKKTHKSSNIFDESITEHEETISYFAENLSKDSDFKDISNFVENLIITNSLYNFNDYLKYINELNKKNIINTYQHYMLVSEASEFDVFCEECGVYLKNNQLGQLVRAYCLCLECS